MTYRTFISIVLAAAVAVTGISTTPARAGNDDVAKWIAGAVAVGIIGAAISEQRKKERARERARVDQYPRYDDSYHRHGKHKKPVYHDDRFNRDAIPGHCRRKVETHRGEVRGFGRRCLLNHYSGFNALPHQCAVKVRTYSGKRRVIYSGRCLRQHGYRVMADSR